MASLGLVAASLAVVAGTVSPAQAVPNVTINLVGINDFHGRIDANTVKWAGTVEQLKASAPNAIVVGAGDLIGASTFASAIADDQPTIEVMNAIKLQASAVGNHEFDKGWPDLRDRVIGTAPNADWTYLAANVYAKGTTTPVLKEYVEFTKEGVDVAVIGAVTQETPSLVAPGGISTLDFGDPVAAVNRVAAQLSDGNEANGEADVLVASFHAGSNVTSGYANALAAGGEFANMANLNPNINAIFNGHTHQAYVYDQPVTGGDQPTRPMVQTGSYGANVGQVLLTYDTATDKVIGSSATNTPRVTTSDSDLIAAYPALQGVKTTVDASLANAKVVGDQPVGKISADVTTAYQGGAYTAGKYTGGERDERGKESTLGDLVADALRDGIPAAQGKADIGIVNPSNTWRRCFFSAGADEVSCIAHGVQGSCGSAARRSRARMKSQMRLKPFPVKPKKVALRCFCRDRPQRDVASIPTTARPMTAVAVQPTPRSQPRTGNRPLMSCREAISIMTAISGTAITPLSTAVQSRALIGLIPVKLIVIPTRVASTTVP